MWEDLGVAKSKDKRCLSSNSTLDKVSVCGIQGTGFETWLTCCLLGHSCDGLSDGVPATLGGDEKNPAHLKPCLCLEPLGAFLK